MFSSWSKIFCAFLVAVGSLNEAPLCGQETPPSATGTVRVYLTVSDKKNLPAPVPEFNVSALIDKHPSRIMSLARAGNEKLVFAVLVDTSGSNYDHAEAVRQAALELFQGLAANNQDGYLITFGVNAFSTSRPVMAPQAQKMMAAVNFYGPTALFEAVISTCRTRLAKAANTSTPRRVILLLSDGDDNYSRATLDQAENVALTEGVSIFSLSIPSEDAPSANHVLTRLTQATGGKNIVDKDLVRGARSLVSALDTQWALNLEIPPNTGSQLHALAIASYSKDIKISAPVRVQLP